jgi:cobyrinic acid a,c-diamide synthase
MEKVNRILIAGTKSGSGKTTITCGILQCLMDKGYKVTSFKCGPDYIDPMFHSKVIGTKSGNLDSFFTDSETLKHLLIQNSAGTDISVLEGVMGYYDGIGFSEEGSTYSVAAITKTPAILILDAKGISNSLGAILKGFLTYKPDSNIKGVIFNQLPASLYPEAENMAEEFGIKSFGFVPNIPEAFLESRHLGLVTADEINDLKIKLEQLAERLNKTIDVDGIVKLAAEAKEINSNYTPTSFKVPGVRIAVAMDEAFCFHYKDNFELLKSMGAEIVPFSPLKDKFLPEHISGLILNGGYPELYTKSLSENCSLLSDIKSAIENNLPVIAECGGFMYLHEFIEDMQGEKYPMVGVFKGSCVKTNSLQRFGYIKMKAAKDNLLTLWEEEIKAHEFHYWDSEDCGNGFHAIKANGKKEWDCGIVSESMYAGFPHLYFYNNTAIAERFLTKCMDYIG